jgi:diguanylate cyclase (GGDEF)-like protein
MLALISCVSGLAQHSTFRQYDAADGLTDMTVYSLLQDHTGYIWVGTDNGLFRYDGSRFLAFRDEDGLPDSTVLGMAESPQGVLWVATRGGVVRQSGRRFEAVNDGVSGVIRAVAFDSLGRVYLKSADGIVRGTREGAEDYRFQMIVRGKVGGLWVHGTGAWFSRDGDLWRLHGEQAERIGSPAGLPGDKWSAILGDLRGNLWAESATHLYELPHGESRFVDRSMGLPHASLLGLDADSLGRVFVSTDAGVVILDGEQRTTIDAQHGLPADGVRQVMLDREGSLWLGTEGGGLIRRLGRGQWLSWKKADGLLHNTIWTVHRDSAGQAWVGSSGGLNLIDSSGNVTGSWTSHNGLVGNEVYALAEGPGGDMYVATYPSGMSRFSQQGDLVKTYRSPSVLSAGWVMAMAVDREGRLWTVGSAGCYRSRLPIGSGEPTFERVEIPGMGEETSFFDVRMDKDGVVWIGSSRGMARYSNGQWKVFTERDGLKASGVASIAFGQGAVWVGYRDAHGLTRLRIDGERVKATHFTRQDGLSSDRIYALVFDSSARLWASSDAGVNVLDQGRWRHYYREDGLVWNDTDSLALDSGPDGSVWVGTSAGLSRYSPPRYPAAETAPAVVITAIEGGSRQWEASDRPTLPFQKRTLIVHYSALSYAAESRTRFRYRLQGGDWTLTREKSVRFEGLPAGDYVFQVIAAGANGLSSLPTEFSFSITPPWWQSWWFVTACLAAALLLASALWRLRVRVLIEQKKRLESQVAGRTAELVESHRQLEEIASCDMLTSLPNRRKFTQRFRIRLETACSRGERFALMLIDLDGFKRINDTFGHDAGDAVLVETAIRLLASVRQTDCVARLGGDEFAILIFAAYDPVDIEEIRTRIVSYIDVGIRYEERELTVGSSVGVAVFPMDGNDETSLYKSADLALYEAKRARPRSLLRAPASTARMLPG